MRNQGNSAVIAKLFEGVKPYDAPEWKAFRSHTDACGHCQIHPKAMCDEGKRLLEEAVR